jgi:SAM-dependent methyltransferase
MTTAVANLTSHKLVPSGNELWLRCSGCSASIGPISDRDDGLPSARIECHCCGMVTNKTTGVWRMLSPREHAQFAKFMRDYEEIRFAEGRGSKHPAFYLALPFADLTSNFTDQWRIRGRSYRFLERHLLPQLHERHGDSFRALDIGAGNGWLSYRLALAGHRPVAVDLCSNALDGLEAASHYASVLPEFFPRVEAQMNHLPFEDGQFDVAIYNASFHYSTNYERTVSEALRCLRPGGTILIVDSPTYEHARSGEAMRLERREAFEAKFGTRSDSLPTGDFLTSGMMENLSGLGVRWKRHLAWYGTRWWLRPWIARLKHRRMPSQFYLYEGRTEST